MKIVILGDGLLGKELKNQTDWGHISRKSNGIDFVKEIDKYFELILKNGYDTIINCIANTNTYGGSLEDHFSTNYERVVDLVNFCNTHSLKLVHISTDYLYTHSVPNAKETDDLKPLDTFYGQSKNAGDFYVQMNSKDFLTIRTSFKPNPFPYNVAVCQNGNFDYVDVISKLVVELILKNASGVFNVGTDFKSMFELAKRTRPDVGIIDKNSPKMPRDISMNLEKMKDFLK